MARTLWSVILLLVSFHASAQEVFLQRGDVYLKNERDEMVQMTASGLDSEAVLSPDGKFIAFVRDTPGVLVTAGVGDINATELWLLNVSTRKAELLVRGKSGPEMEKTIAGIASPRFSLDGRTIYFLSFAWVTSGSIQMVSVKTKKLRFITDGVALDVIYKAGEYRGFLLIDRALIKSDSNGNSLGRDVYLWLYSPDGKPVREIGQTDGEAAEKFRAEVAIIPVRAE